MFLIGLTRALESLMGLAETPEAAAAAEPPVNGRQLSLLGA